MKMELGLGARLEQRMRLAPQIIQSIEILQLPLLALEERIEQELVENPALEMSIEQEKPKEEDQDRPERTEEEKPTSAEEDFSRLDEFHQDYLDFGHYQTIKRDPSEADPKHDALQNTPSGPPSLREHLMEQLRFLELDTQTREMAEFLINNIDRDGRLEAGLDELVASLEEQPPREVAQKALEIVQSLDPAGVGARDLKECLLLQLDPEHPDHDLHKRLIENHLEDIENNRLPLIARELGLDIDDVKMLIEYITHLDPAPGRLYDTEEVPYITPDVIVEIIDGRFEIYLNEPVRKNLRVNPFYLRLQQKSGIDQEAYKFLRQRIDSAQWLISAIEQRRETLLKISRRIVELQKDFMEKGVNALKPMKMQEVADSTDVHVSTVSRAVNQKYMQTPWGVYPMKFFFSGGKRTAEGENESYNSIKERIREIVEAEDKSKPLSDEDIVAKLAEAGTKVARRTVTKYRKQLNIPSSRKRKEY